MRDPSVAQRARGLWCAVLYQAFRDAKSESIYPDKRNARRDARRWLTGASRDLAEFCALAGVSFEMVNSKAKRMFGGSE